MSIIIRKMVREDINSVQKVAQQSWHTTYEDIIPYNIQENFLNTAYNHDMMVKRLASSYLFVAEKKGQVVGFANFSTVNCKGQLDLHAIYLVPTCQGNGIGTALLQKGIGEIEHIKEVYVEVEKENKTGIYFYEAKGFKTIKEYDDNFDGHILKTVLMVLKL